MLRIYGYEMSSNVQKVAWTCDELGLPFELDRTGGAYRSSKDPDYLKLNPNGQIPTLQDGDFILWESNTILRYIVEKHGGGRLWPQPPEGRAIASKWMDWQIATLSGPMGAIFLAVLRTKPEQRDPAAVASASERAAAMWTRFEQDFGDGPFVAGDFSIGDIPVGIMANRWYAIPGDKPKLPKTEAWFARLKARKPFIDRVFSQPQPGPK